MSDTAEHPRAEDVRRRETRVIRVVSARISLRQRFRDIWSYRELLVGLTRKELKVKYKNSILGFLWSLLNPATVLLVYFVVFQIILKNGIPTFAIFLISGILVWNLFSTALPGACVSVTGNGSIVKKVAFPREVLALASVGASLIHFFLQTLVLVAFLVAFRHGPAVGYLPLVIPALACLLVLTAAIGVLLAAINVRLRDTQHLLDVGLTVWFWATPIVYPYRLVRDNVAKNGHSIYHTIFYLYRLNPVTPIVLAFQRALYGKTSPRGKGGLPVHILPDHAGLWWYTWQLLLVLTFSVVLFCVALKVFGRLEGNFAEEL
jgi:ABC-2 type transport system permease protein